MVDTSTHWSVHRGHVCTLYSTICCIQPTCSILHENNGVILIVYNFHFKFNMNLCYATWDSLFFFLWQKGEEDFCSFYLEVLEEEGIRKPKYWRLYTFKNQIIHVVQVVSRKKNLVRHLEAFKIIILTLRHSYVTHS